ncbi:hypothetical protein H6G54_28820 [Anabaena cylindrica FACHB-243]|nr:hypothetical protein [Anabaena cylindrica FACHB-243]MBY5308223.1 hypothetical protein [Anabaena sp. CCAP 1446/1C]
MLIAQRGVSHRRSLNPSLTMSRSPLSPQGEGINLTVSTLLVKSLYQWLYIGYDNNQSSRGYLGCHRIIT